MLDFEIAEFSRPLPRPNRTEIGIGWFELKLQRDCEKIAGRFWAAGQVSQIATEKRTSAEVLNVE